MNINFDNLVEINRGRHSIIYQLNDFQILKLYESNFLKEKIFEEYKKTILISKLEALRVPKPIEFVSLNNKYGIIFERVRGNSIMQQMLAHPFKFFRYLKQVTEVQHEINKESVTLTDQIARYGSLINNSEYFIDSEKTQLISILSREYEPRLCHGDFHHGNIVIDNLGNEYVIDWMDAFIGDYRLDVALSAVALVISNPPEHIPSIFKFLYNFGKGICRLDRVYLKSYGLDFKSMKEYLYLASAIHLIQCEGDTRNHIKYFNYYKKSANSES